MDQVRKWTSYFEEDMAVSIKLPIDWSVGNSVDFQLILLAEEVDGYRVNIAMNKHKFSGSQEDFERSIVKSNLAMAKEYPDYKKLKEVQCWIDGLPSYHQLYSWKSDKPGEDSIFFQTLTLIYDMKSQLLEVNGTTIKSEPAEDIALLEEIIDSIRLIAK